MIETPITQAEAAKALGLETSEASIAIRLLGIPTRKSPWGGRAKLLDAEGFDRLAEAARKLGKSPPS